MERAELVPDEVILALIRDRIPEKDAVNGVMFDGFPEPFHRPSPSAEMTEDLSCPCH